MHRYCTGVNKSIHETMIEKGSAFVCMPCTQAVYKAIVQSTQDEITQLKEEVDSLKSLCYQSTATLSAQADKKDNETLTALQKDVQDLKNNQLSVKAATSIDCSCNALIGNLQDEVQQLQSAFKGQSSLYADIVKKGNKKPKHQSNRSTRTAGNSPDDAPSQSSRYKIKIEGLRKVWGTKRSETPSTITESIGSVYLMLT